MRNLYDTIPGRLHNKIKAIINNRFNHTTTTLLTGRSIQNSEANYFKEPSAGRGNTRHKATHKRPLSNKVVISITQHREKNIRKLMACNQK